MSRTLIWYLWKCTAMDPAEFVSIIRRHERFVKGGSGRQRANLTDVDLSGLRLPGINLQTALLARLNLKKTIVTGGDFRFADLFCANLKNLEGKETDLFGADMQGVQLHGADLRGANLQEVDQRPGSMRMGEAERSADLSDCQLDGENLSQAKMTQSYLPSASLRQADMSEATLDRAEMTGTDLSGGNLDKADFSEANLTGAKLKNASVQGTNFSGANMRGIDLEANDLSEADLSSVLKSSSKDTLVPEIRNVIGQHELWSSSGGTEGMRANLSGMNLRNIDFSGSSLSGAGFSKANLFGANSCFRISPMLILRALISRWRTCGERISVMPC